MILDLTRCILVAQATDSAASVEAAEPEPEAQGEPESAPQFDMFDFSDGDSEPENL